jgi:hypothetical protein
MTPSLPLHLHSVYLLLFNFTVSFWCTRCPLVLVLYIWTIPPPPPCLAYSSTLNMETWCSSDTSERTRLYSVTSQKMLIFMLGFFHPELMNQNAITASIIWLWCGVFPCPCNLMGWQFMYHPLWRQTLCCCLLHVPPFSVETLALLFLWCLQFLGFIALSFTLQTFF